MTLGDKGIMGITTWGWSDTVGARRVTVNVSAAGPATINLWVREDGVRVDRLLLTKDAGYTPSGVGPAESPRQ